MPWRSALPHSAGMLTESDIRLTIMKDEIRKDSVDV